MRQNYFKPYINLIHFIICFMLTPLLFSGCGSSLKLTSYWHDRGIGMKGDQADWNGAVSWVKDKQVAVGFFNDDTHLYIHFLSEKRMQFQPLLLRGLTLWVEPKDGSSKRIGIVYPTGVQRPLRVNQAGRREPGELAAIMKSSLHSIKLIRPDKKMHILPVETPGGVAGNVSGLPNRFFYELRLPLKDPELTGLELDPGTTIKIGFETVDVKAEGRKRVPGMVSGRGRGGRRGGRRPGGAGGGLRRAGNRPGVNPFKMQIEVKLSSSSSKIKATLSE